MKNKSLFKIKGDPKVLVVYNGISFPDYKEVMADKFQFLKNKDFILNIGVMFPKKNQLCLIQMLKYIKEDLVLVSSDINLAYEKKILNSIQEHNLENRVHILKYISEEEKIWLLKNCRALVHPSIAEGFGVPPIESMFFGKPVFLSNLTSLPEIGGDLAFYFQNFSPEHMADVYEKGMKNYDAAPEDYAYKLRQRANIFSAANMAEGYEKIYQSLLK